MYWQITGCRYGTSVYKSICILHKNEHVPFGVYSAAGRSQVSILYRFFTVCAREYPFISSNLAAMVPIVYIRGLYDAGMTFSFSKPFPSSTSRQYFKPGRSSVTSLIAFSHQIFLESAVWQSNVPNAFSRVVCMPYSPLLLCPTFFPTSTSSSNVPRLSSIRSGCSIYLKVRLLPHSLQKPRSPFDEER